MIILWSLSDLMESDEWNWNGAVEVDDSITEVKLWMKDMESSSWYIFSRPFRLCCQ